jgi:hypothetical protein
MHPWLLITLFFTATSVAEAFHISSSPNYISRTAHSLSRSLFKRQDACKVWTEISDQLTGEFLSNGQCNDNARAAIRAAFHDCFNGACDGSLILAKECGNSENTGLSGICSKLQSIATSKDVGVADIIQFAAAHAIRTCPGGPAVPIYIGRTDSSTSSPTGVLPTGTASGDSILAVFSSKGFSATDLAALVGAHTAARQFQNTALPGTPLDSTPGVWDNTYYKETLEGKAPQSIPADKNLANHSVVGESFKEFANNAGGWAAAFVPAMSKLSLMGVDGGSGKLTDCTSALPGGTSKRDIRARSVFDRLRWR